MADNETIAARARWVAEQLNQIAERADRDELTERDPDLVDGAWSGLIGTDGARAMRMAVLASLDGAYRRTMLNGLVRQHRRQGLTPAQQAVLRDERGFARGLANEAFAAMRSRGQIGEMPDTAAHRIETVRKSLLLPMFGIRFRDDQQIAEALDAWTRTGRPAKGQEGKWHALSKLVLQLGLGDVDPDALRADWNAWDWAEFRAIERR